MNAPDTKVDGDGGGGCDGNLLVTRHARAAVRVWIVCHGMYLHLLLSSKLCAPIYKVCQTADVSARQLRLVLFLQYFPIQLLVAPNELRRICLARIFATCGHSQQSDRFRWTLHNRIQSECGIYERDANAGGGLDLMADRYSLQKKETKFERIISSAMSMCCCRCGRCRHRLRTLNHLWQFEMRLQHLTHWQLIHLLTSTWEFR